VRPSASGKGLPESGAALERIAETLYHQGDYSTSAARYERVFAAYRREGSVAAAGRAARTLAWITGNVLGDWAVQSGWLARARRILEEAGPDGPEHGWVLILTSFSEPDMRVRESLLREAMAVGRRLRDPDVEFEALAYLGGLCVLTDRVAEGLVHLDEAMAAACAGELTDFATVDNMFCGFFWACELVNDVPGRTSGCVQPLTGCSAAPSSPPSAAPTTAASSPRPAAGARRRPSSWRPPASSTAGCRPGGTPR
jgi:hypothetical protein